MAGLTKFEIKKVVYRYIGVSSGYLGDFTYSSHFDFYPLYCDLEINPYELTGTTRERFTKILTDATPDVQAKILRGVLQRFPLDDETTRPPTRTKKLYEDIEAMVRRLELTLPIVTPQITSTVVEQAIRDIEILLNTGQPVSCVDRVHTLLHGYLRAICDSAGIKYKKDDGMTRLFKLLRQEHGAFSNLGTMTSEIERVLNSFANIMDAFNPVRDHASVAHPNEKLLNKDEATLIINVGRTLLHYIDAKITSWTDDIPF